MIKIYISGNYLIVEADRKTYEFAMRWTIYRYNNTTRLIELNEFTGGKYIFTNDMITREQIVDENENPFTFESLTDFLRNYTAQ
jgi:hypothetical protein